MGGGNANSWKGEGGGQPGSCNFICFREGILKSRRNSIPDHRKGFRIKCEKSFPGLIFAFGDCKFSISG